MSESHHGTLRRLHEAADAEFQTYGEQEIVLTYGRLPMEYAALYRSAGLMDCSHRGLIAVEGPERITFLNSVLTAELVNKATGKAISPGESRFAFLLDRKGRILAEMNVLETGTQTLLEMDARLLAATARELEKYHFREKVTITAKPGAFVELALFGPAAEKISQSVTPALRWSETIGQVPAVYLLVEPSAAEQTWQTLLQQQAVPIGWAAYNAARVEAGRPLLGIDYDATFLPAETGQLDRAVSFTKGCYPGQEIVARMKSHEQCPRKVVSLQLETDALPLAGEKVFDASSNEIGAITSSTISPRLSNRAVCLACLKKPHFAPGTQVSVPAEGQFRRAVVG
jgi:folate-binding protein YgfZ